MISAEVPFNSRIHMVQEFNQGVFDYLIATDKSFVNAAEGQAGKGDKEELEEGAEGEWEVMPEEEVEEEREELEEGSVPLGGSDSDEESEGGDEDGDSDSDSEERAAAEEAAMEAAPSTNEVKPDKKKDKAAKEARRGGRLWRVSWHRLRGHLLCDQLRLPRDSGSYAHGIGQPLSAPSVRR